MSEPTPKGKATDRPGVVLREHVFDGIEEYDQKLPNWWLFTLYIMIVFFVIYWFLYYQVGMFASDAERIDAKIAVIDQKRDAQLQEMLATLDDKSLWEMSRDSARVEAGHAIFAGKCVACHGEDLSGYNAEGGKLAGQPLNDTEWLYGGNPMDVFNTISNGSPNLLSGMIPWKNMMSPADVAKVTAFVMSHHKEGEEWTKGTPTAPVAAPAEAAAPAAAPAEPPKP
ncbi:MAG: c-type cytochrome [Verrucomicrobiae bacterium]|nr:c-type cytochrome [Verrucomicrobiae bacterium]